MPMYEFECSEGHRIEQRLEIKNCPEKIKCPICMYSGLYNLAEKVWSVPTYLQSPATVIWRGANGEISVPGSANEPTPKDMVREEYTNVISRGKLEKELQRQTDAKTMLSNIAHEVQVTEARKKRHEDLNARMSSIAAQSDNPTRTKLMLTEAMNYTKNKKPKRRKAVNSIIKVNHLDRGNL